MDGPRVLCVAGDDPGAGAGLQRDREMVERLGGRFVGVVAVHTVQDRRGLQAVSPASPERVAAELAAALAGGVDAIKTGALGTAAVVHALADALEGGGARAAVPLVVDPVRGASKTAVEGLRLLDERGWSALRERLLPRATLATPNRAEYADGAAYSACPAVLLTGGDDGGAEVVDRLLRPGQPPVEYRQPRLPGAESTHGTGCALSSALAVELARGQPVEPAARRAIQTVRDWLASNSGSDID